MSKKRVFLFLILLLFGLIPLLNSVENPRLAGLRPPDYLRLIGSGMCFGFGFGVLLGPRRFLGE